MDRMSLSERIKAELTSYNGRMGIYIDDFTGNKIEIDSGVKFESASTIKTFILIDLFQQVNDGTKFLDDMLVYSESNKIEGSGVLQSLDTGVRLSVKNFATLMIIVSDNVATNVLIDYLGIDHINSTIEKWGFNDTILHNKINFDKYDKLGTTTPKDYGRVFSMLHEGTLINMESCEQMLEIFRKQHYNSMITKDFPQYYLSGDDSLASEEEQITVASKSGSMNACRNDGGIVSTVYGDYVIVMFNKNFYDPLYYPGHDATYYGAKVSRMVLDQYLALKGRLEL
ncbi:serine hydrolase [Sedimentibacter sp.]|uniref:serine hydrolase n=1 Tax=Sedimentibacter sp. TaxID=1960295 RepID=UPI00289A757B|nr:serine hydrolase [Sedimentibacter sp.]